MIASDGASNPSTRLRILQYIPKLEQSGYAIDTYFVRRGERRSNALSCLVDAADLVFVQRILSKSVLDCLMRSSVPVIFDCDDAIHYIRPSQYQRAVAARTPVDWVLNGYRFVTRGSRYYSGHRKLLEVMLARATATIVGNRLLLEEFDLNEEHTIVLPTAVWIDDAPAKTHDAHLPITIGWIGVQSNLVYLQRLDPVFCELHDRYGADVELLVVSGDGFQTSLQTRFVEWSLETEEKALLSFDVGIMPLSDDPFSRGKCAFKAIFCMSRGIPVVVSPVGANNALIDHGVDGFLASDTSEWVEALCKLVDDVDLRSKMGRRARRKIERSYSAADVASRLEQLLLTVSSVGSGNTTEAAGAQRNYLGHPCDANFYEAR